MKHKITEIELLLDKMNLLFSDIKSDGRIDKLEAGLFLKYVKQLNEKIEEAAGINSATAEKEMIIDPVVKKELPKQELPVIKPEPKREETVEKKDKPEINIRAFEELKKQTEHEVKKEMPLPEKTTIKKSPILIPDDEEDDLHTGLNHKLSKDKKTLADKIHHKKSSDLRTMIDLNDRIYFIRELFKGDSHAFDKAVKHLNLLNSKTEAKVYLEQELKHQFGWSDDEAIMRFTEVIEHKFS